MRFSGSERVEWRDPTPFAQFTEHDLTEYRKVLDQHIKQICDQMQVERFRTALDAYREGINRMTINQNETKTATLDTPDGTLLVLVDDSTLLAEAGALAIVDGSVKESTDRSRFLNVRWIKGHHKDGMSQMNGGYDPETFEVHEFQPGDRVRVVDSPFELGYEGVICEIPAQNGDDCVVAVDTPYSTNLSYRFDRLSKVESKEDDLKKLRDLLQESWNPETIFGGDPFDAGEEADEDEADEEPDFEVGQRVTVKYGSEMWDGPGTVTHVGHYVNVKPDHAKSTGGFRREEIEPLTETFEVGAVVVTAPPAKRRDLSEWDGLRFRVKSVYEDEPHYPLLEAIDTRPDGFGTSDFHWEAEWLRAFDPERDFRVGDIVDATNLSGDARGVATRLEGDFGGDIEVNWETGLPALVDSDPLGYTRAVSALVGVHPDGEGYKAPVRPIEEKVAEEGDEVTVTGNVSGVAHFLRIGSRATVQAVTLITAGDWAGRYEYKVLGEERFDGELLTQFLVSDDLEKYEAPVIEVGAEVASPEVLYSLPMGTVLVIDGDENSPVVKTGNSFSRVNRFSEYQDARPRPQAYFEDDRVREAADGTGRLTIGYLPANAA